VKLERNTENSCTTGGKGLPKLTSNETMNRKAFVEGNVSLECFNARCIFP
jgi:hypothetical protein